MVNSVLEALNAPAIELISAAINPATTMPRTPTGSTDITSIGNAACATAATGLPSGPTIEARAGDWPVLASARAIIPGMMKMNTGSSLRNDAKIVPRRAVRSSGAPRARWTMYWSVHQYQRPMIGAQKSIPSHG